MTNKELQELLGKYPDDLVIYQKTSNFLEKVSAVRLVPQLSKIGNTYPDIIVLED